MDKESIQRIKESGGFNQTETPVQDNPDQEVQPEMPVEQEAQLEETVTEPTQQDNQTTSAEPINENPNQQTETQDQKASPFNISELTGGKYSDFNELWNDFQNTQSKDEDIFPDEFIKGAVEYYKKQGDLTPYLEAKTVDYDQMSDEEIIKRSMREEYAGLDDKSFNRLFNKKLREKYSLDEDSYDEEDVELGRALLSNDAKKLRENYKEQQAKFAAPESNESELKQQQEQLLDEWKRTVDSSDVVNSIKSDKKFTISYGDETFNYEVGDADDLYEAVVDAGLSGQKIFQNFITEQNGQATVDFERFAKVYEMSKNPDAYEKRLIEFGKSLGQDKMLDDLQNPTTIDTPNRKSPSVDGRASFKDRFAAHVRERYGNNQ